MQQADKNSPNRGMNNPAVKTLRILVVEDEEALANGLKFNFEQEGYDVEVAGDGQSALDRFRDAESPFHLIIMDLMLPVMSGYEACQEIR